MDKITICQKLIAIARQRIADTLTCQLDDLPELPLGRAINLLFLIRGEAPSIGEYGATMAAVYAAVGDLLWKLPGEFVKQESSQVFVQ